MVLKNIQKNKIKVKTEKNTSFKKLIIKKKLFTKKQFKKNNVNR